MLLLTMFCNARVEPAMLCCIRIISLCDANLLYRIFAMYDSRRKLSIAFGFSVKILLWLHIGLWHLLHEIKWNLAIFYKYYLNNKMVMVRIASLLTNFHSAILEAEIRFYFLPFLHNIHIIFTHQAINSQSVNQLWVIVFRILSWILIKISLKLNLRVIFQNVF